MKRIASKVMIGVPVTSGSTDRSSVTKRSAPSRSQMSTAGWMCRRNRPCSLVNLRRSSGGMSLSPIGRGERFACSRWKLRTKSL